MDWRTVKGLFNVFVFPRQKGFLTFGSWQLPLEEIREFCSERRLCAWAARCTLTSKSGVRRGEVLAHYT